MNRTLSILLVPMQHPSLHSNATTRVRPTRSGSDQTSPTILPTHPLSPAAATAIVIAMMAESPSRTIQPTCRGYEGKIRPSNEEDTLFTPSTNAIHVDSRSPSSCTAFLAHKDQIYHKQLARALPVDSFRFDFRANGETPGTWSMSNLADDVEDLVTVVDYLRTKLEYTVEIVIGHSRGGLDGFAWFVKHCPDALPPSLRVPFFVGLSVRFNMSNIRERDPAYLSAFAKEGFFRWQARVMGQDKELHVFPEQVEQFAAWPTREIALAFPYNTDVLLIHGTADKSVPASDVTSYGNILSGIHRRPGSLSIKLIDHADHIYRGFYPQVVEAIVEWLRERSELTKMGLSAAAIRDRDMLGLARFNPTHMMQGRGMDKTWGNDLAAPAGASGGLTGTWVVMCRGGSRAGGSTGKGRGRVMRSKTATACKLGWHRNHQQVAGGEKMSPSYARLMNGESSTSIPTSASMTPASAEHPSPPASTVPTPAPTPTSQGQESPPSSTTTAVPSASQPTTTTTTTTSSSTLQPPPTSPSRPTNAPYTSNTSSASPLPTPILVSSHKSRL